MRLSFWPSVSLGELSWGSLLAQTPKSFLKPAGNLAGYQLKLRNLSQPALNQLLTLWARIVFDSVELNRNLGSDENFILSIANAFKL